MRGDLIEGLSSDLPTFVSRFGSDAQCGALDRPPADVDLE